MPWLGEWCRIVGVNWNVAGCGKNTLCFVLELQFRYIIGILNHWSNKQFHTFTCCIQQRSPILKESSFSSYINLLTLRQIIKNYCVLICFLSFVYRYLFIQKWLFFRNQQFSVPNRRVIYICFKRNKMFLNL